jgi:putative SOS response-associated peptidase YedK
MLPAAIMCGRTTLSTPPSDLRDLFGLDDTSSLATLQPRYNIAPTQPIAVVRDSRPRTLELLRWGLLLPGVPGINARVETVARAPAYRSSFRSRRCLVIIDGFFEWKKAGTRKQPFLIQRPDRRPFALAGIWDRMATRDGELIDCCAILTKSAVGPVATLLDRMPVILATEQYDPWLHSAAEATALLGGTEMVLDLKAVSTLVNRPANDDPRCIEPPEMEITDGPLFESLARRKTD